MQFSAVLAHLHHYFPEDKHIVVAHKGRHNALEAFADCRALEDVDQRWLNWTLKCKNTTHAIALSESTFKQKIDEVLIHGWRECEKSLEHSPSTKAAICLKELFKVEIRKDLLRYRIQVNPDRREAVDRYVNSLPSKQFAVVHYIGHTSKMHKGMHEDEAREMCDFLAARGITPVILDWYGQSKLPDDKRIFCPGIEHWLWRNWATGCAMTIAALIERAAVTVCIDSGPGKIALAVSGTPALQVWRHMHPVHYCDYAEHALHLIPPFHETYIKQDTPVRLAIAPDSRKGVGLKFFEENYRYAVYDQNKLGRTAGELAWRLANRIPLSGKQDGDAIKVSEPAQAVYGRSGLLNLRKVFDSGFVVGIPTLNRYELLLKCLDSIAESKLPPKVVLVIDNGGLLNHEWIRSRYRVKIITPEQNLGVAASWNLLHKLASPLPLVIMNDDIEVEPGTLAHMLSVDQPVVLASGWSCFTMAEDVWKKVGDFDDAFVAYHEDDDMRHRLALAGIQPTVIEAGCKHVGSATRQQFTADEEAAFKERWQREHEYYQRKHGGLPGRETFAKPFDGKDSSCPPS